ncbi:MAG: hypothetical protein ACRDRZ_02945 [Pseudonocardiaceae bacterium]
MTDDDRDILDCLARLNRACAVLAAGVIEDDLSYDQHLELALQFIQMAERVLKRALAPVAVVDARPYVTPPSTVEGDAR